MIFPDPRRFAYLWEYDRRGVPICGTREQQDTIIESWKRHAPFGSKLDLVLRVLAKSVKSKGSGIYANIEFLPNIPFGTANWAGVRLNSDITGETLESTFWHELGHTLGINLFSDPSEGWAHSFTNWIFGGQNEDHPVWQRLKPLTDS